MAKWAEFRERLWARKLRAGDVFEIERDDTAKQWIGAGFVTEVKARRKSSGPKTSGRRLTSRGKR
jgi:hypothetical protein